MYQRNIKIHVNYSLKELFKMCKRGDVYFVELPKKEGSSIQGGLRPLIVVQNNMGNKFSPTVLGVTTTSKMSKKQLPTHVMLKAEDGLNVDSIALCEQVFTINKSDLSERNFVCTLSEEKIKQIDKALSVSIGIDREEIRPDEILMNEMLDILKTKKVNSKKIMTMFVRYCEGFGIDAKNYTSNLA
jgi:mRNA interferase MazF